MSETPFNSIYLQLSKKERLAVLYGMKNYHSEYHNIHMGQLSFLTCRNVLYAMKLLGKYSLDVEGKKKKPAIPSKLVQAVINKMLGKDTQVEIHLNSKRVKSMLRRKYGADLFITHVPICDGRVMGNVTLSPHTYKSDVWIATAKKTEMTEIVEQLSYMYGKWN